MEPRVAVVPGDGASPQAMAATLSVLQAVEPPVRWDVLPSGDELAEVDAGQRVGMIHPGLDAADTVLLGSTSGVTPGVMHLRYGRGTWANLRPVRWRPGFASPYARPEEIDYLIVRESHEDLYIAFEGDLADLRSSGLADGVPGARVPTGDDGRYAVKVFTRDNIERIAHYACGIADGRKAEGHPGSITIGAKTNMMTVTDRYFARIVTDIVEAHGGLEVETVIVDDLAHRLALRPWDYDVVVLPNQYGDILADAGAGCVGGMTVTPSGCFGDDFAYFEAPQGAPPPADRAAMVNPTALLLAGAWMLDHLGLTDHGSRVEQAVERVYAAGDVLPEDQGGTATTEEFVGAVLDAL